MPPVSPIRPLLALILVSTTLGASLPAAAAKVQSYPYDVQIEVAFGDDVGSEEVRRTLEREVLREFDDRGCFESVSRFDAATIAPDSLLMRVVVASVVRETVYDTSIAQRSEPDAPPEVLDRYETVVKAAIGFELLLPAESLLVRERSFHVIGSHRPEGGEDARAVARQKMIDEVAQSARIWACKGSPKKLARQLDSARAGASR